MIDADTKRQAQMSEDRRTQAKIDADLTMNEADNETAIAIAKARAVDKDQKVGGMTSGKGTTNPNP